jgi:hypothetical protein
MRRAGHAAGDSWMVSKSMAFTAPGSPQAGRDGQTASCLAEKHSPSIGAYVTKPHL